MITNKMVKTTAAAVFIAVSSVFLTDCTSMVTEEQLATLQDLRRQEATLQDDITKAKNTLTSLKSELSKSQAELKDCNEQTSFVKEKLSQWPDVWPDSK